LHLHLDGRRVIAILSTAAIAALAKWEEWLNLSRGLGDRVALVIGIIVAMLAAVEL
jgi:hypothetical protein